MGNGVFVEAWVLTVSPGSSTQSSSRYAAGLAGEITSEATLISSTRGDEMVVTDSCHHSPSSVVTVHPVWCVPGLWGCYPPTWHHREPGRLMGQPANTLHVRTWSYQQIIHQAHSASA